MSEVKVYGTEWCHDTHLTRDQLDGLGIPYEYHDIEKEPEAAQWVKDINGGKQITPTVDILGEILAEPTENELGSVLRATGLMA